jgi:hypothetical protein
MPAPTKTLIDDFTNGQPTCIVTTQVDADVCCAAAWAQLNAGAEELSPDTITKLRAIAVPGDRLMVPQLKNGAIFSFPPKLAQGLEAATALVS